MTPQRLPRVLELDGETVTVFVRESTRARSLRVRLGPHLPLEAIVPRRVGDAQLDRFLHDRRDWIARNLPVALSCGGVHSMTTAAAGLGTLLAERSFLHGSR